MLRLTEHLHYAKYVFLQETGAFAEHGEVHHKDMQGGASEGGLGLTAYVVVALLENGVRVGLLV